MAIDERSRHALYVKLEQVLGAEDASVLMEHLPPLGWADVTTKRDLDGLEARLGLRLEATEQRILATLRAEVAMQTAAQTRAMVFALSASVLCVAGLAFAATRLI